MIYIVSDLHIDPIDGFFTPVKSKFHDFLDMVGDNYLIINGDLLDLWSWSLTISFQELTKTL
jgi:UDP-2,3-diacylglucosamine pyrophosphatase LpxH